MVNETIRIFCRLKPCSRKQNQVSYDIRTRDDSGEQSLSLALPKEHSEGLVNNKKEQYSSKFLRVFDQDAGQDEVFDSIARPVVDKVLEGFNGTVFAYGQTGSGKTFTVTGGAEKFSDRGLIPRTLSHVFARSKNFTDADFRVAVSYLEIYNEVGFDLLDPKHDITKLEDLPRVTIMEDSDSNIHLRNLSIQPAASEEEALNLLFLGDTNRMIAETPMNQASTRSHCIFTIHVSMRRPGSDIVRRSKMHLVDLAGSERVSKTGVSGVLLTEAKYINLSLHYLEQVIIALSESHRSHVPYRNSLMTSVLRDSLGGNCITAMVATCAVERRNALESVSTCRFAQRVAQVKNDAHVNEEADPQAVISRLKREVQQLRDQLSLSSDGGSTEPLTPDEIERCQNLVKQYVADSNLESDLPVRADMRLIQFCFQLLKRDIKLHVCQPALPPPPPELPPQRLVLSDLDLAALTDPTGHLPPEVVRLKQIVQQRDNEIAVLTSMLRRERERTKTVVTATSENFNGSGSRLGSNSSVAASISSSQQLPMAPIRNEQRGSVSSGSTATSTKESDPAKQTAFDAFVKTHPMRHVFEKQREELKQKYTEAKATGDSLVSSKDRMTSLKSELDRVRQQIAVASAVSSSTSDDGLASREVQLRERLEQERGSYRDCVERLKAMRSEIDHLHHLHTGSRAKLVKQFEESQYLERTGVTAAFERTQSSDSVSLENTRQEAAETKRALNIPATGDGEVDENIAAFLRARQALMARAAANAGRPGVDES